MLGLLKFGNVAWKGLRIAATVAVSVALLVVFGSLFASADAAFADLIDQAVPDIDGGTVARWIFVFAVSAFVLGGAAFLRAGPPDLTGLEQAGKRRVARLEWAVPLILLVLLFAMFVAVQLTVLFGGSKHVLDTDGLTYADVYHQTEVEQSAYNFEHSDVDFLFTAFEAHERERSRGRRLRGSVGLAFPPGHAVIGRARSGECWSELYLTSRLTLNTG